MVKILDDHSLKYDKDEESKDNFFLSSRNKVTSQTINIQNQSSKVSSESPQKSNLIIFIFP